MNMGIPGSRYVQLLRARQPGMNNGTTMGGLAHALQQGLTGYMMGQERQEGEQSRQTLTKALQAMAGTPEQTIAWNQPTRPDGTGAPTTAIPAVPGNRGLRSEEPHR